ncbi:MULTISPECIES: hypothetical protein [Enterococcus]|nr:hypothetical protein [Enterococcus avium]
MLKQLEVKLIEAILKCIVN